MPEKIFPLNIFYVVKFRDYMLALVITSNLKKAEQFANYTYGESSGPFQIEEATDQQIEFVKAVGGNIHLW
jgi:hypothetical protein